MSARTRALKRERARRKTQDHALLADAIARFYHADALIEREAPDAHQLRGIGIVSPPPPVKVTAAPRVKRNAPGTPYWQVRQDTMALERRAEKLAARAARKRAAKLARTQAQAQATRGTLGSASALPADLSLAEG